jgi:hypothetical protein
VAAAPAAAAAAAPHSATREESDARALNATSGLIEDGWGVGVDAAIAPVELVINANAASAPENFLELLANCIKRLLYELGSQRSSRNRLRC